MLPHLACGVLGLWTCALLCDRHSIGQKMCPRALKARLMSSGDHWRSQFVTITQNTGLCMLGSVHSVQLTEDSLVRLDSLLSGFSWTSRHCLVYCNWPVCRCTECGRQFGHMLCDILGWCCNLFFLLLIEHGKSYTWGLFTVLEPRRPYLYKF